jgi:hydroxyethylthiazole kinase-like uncharacterized protein yjeF
MQKLFDEVNSLDKRCYEEFLLSEDILMEHASNSMASYINQNLSHKKSILIVCGSGNNGADGIALARLLHKKYNVKLYFASEPKSTMSKLQLQRANALEVEIINEVFEADIIVDCIFGTGLNKPLDGRSTTLLTTLNSYNSYKIACDIPSGINILGQVLTIAFEADVTITMGALKTSLFSDIAKEKSNTGGRCYAISGQIGFLKNGDTVPCCLDSKGAMALGNIKHKSLSMLLNSQRAKNIVDGFSKGLLVEDFCKTCGFLGSRLG